MDNQENTPKPVDSPTTLSTLNSNRPSVYLRDDGLIGFRPSGLGECIRGHVAAFKGYEPEPFDAKTLRIMHQGEIHEKHIAKDAELNFSGNILRQVRLSLPIGDWGIIEGTCDGVWFPSTDDYLLALKRFEIKKEGPWHDPDIHYCIEPYREDKPLSIMGFEAKASAPSMFEKMSIHGPGEVYSYQYSIYWAMIEHTLNVTLDGYLFAIGNRLDGDRCFHILDKPKYSKEQILQRCRDIRAALNQDLRHPDSINCDEAEYTYGCKWWRVHKNIKSDQDKSKGSGKSEFDPAFERLIIDDYVISSQMDRLKTEKEEIRLAMERMMRDRKKVSCNIGTVSMCEGKKTIDKDLLASERPDLVSQFTVFDADAAIKSNPEIKDKYSKKTGKDYLMVRPNEKAIDKSKIQSTLKRMEDEGLIDKSRKSYQEMAADRVSEGFLSDMLELDNLLEFKKQSD